MGELYKEIKEAEREMMVKTCIRNEENPKFEYRNPPVGGQVLNNIKIQNTKLKT